MILQFEKGPLCETSQGHDGIVRDMTALYDVNTTSLHSKQPVFLMYHLVGRTSPSSPKRLNDVIL